jgi:Ca2+-transporting ATPase
MGRANAIVRSLPSVSTLAGVDIICTDKTGTLTDGILTLKEIVPGNVSSGSNEEKTTMEYIREAITLCNGAELDKNNEGIGDTLDVAILKDNYKYGINHEDVRDAYKEVDNIPFDSEYKYMGTLNELNGGRKMIVKGAPDVLIERCSLNKNDFDSLSLEIEKHNSNGLRTILVCEKQTDSDSIGHEDINELTYLALLVFEDKLRPNVKESVEISRRAGIRVLMITGDHLMTAKYIGKASGIYNEKTDIALSQDDIENMSNSELRETLPNVSVIARAKPEVKMRVINIFKEQNMVVAMTGDGVNDAPALTAADIGISMGKIGTDVARESSDMVLTDDHFETIVQGIEEARVVFENLRKVIAYLFSTSIGEVIIIIAAISLGYQVPLIAVQILWLNLVTDGFLDVAIATESKENEIMNYSPKRYFGRILSIPHYARIIFLGVIMALGSILVFIFLRENYEIGVARTGTLIAMAAFQWFNAFNVRSEDKSIFKIGVFKNKFLLLAISIVVILQIAAVHLPLMQGLLQTESVDLYIWIGGIIIASSIVFIEEGRKGLFDMLNSKIRFNSINRD